ncbi:hypothetical protein RINTU1_01760 [Candidatus Regiella insecticola]|uniref:Uncharacterized protein n=1 Tax=Candidatus Regiella insecticola TaxID=138073 RepID=A0A6L2ZLH2_9ENTR|nr:hypothetical protein RINTU1_01760 [Candidatus Regiella insecticola]
MSILCFLPPYFESIYILLALYVDNFYYVFLCFVIILLFSV